MEHKSMRRILLDAMAMQKQNLAINMTWKSLKVLYSISYHVNLFELCFEQNYSVSIKPKDYGEKLGIIELNFWEIYQYFKI